MYDGSFWDGTDDQFDFDEEDNSRYIDVKKIRARNDMNL